MKKTIDITEQTVKELQREIEKGKKKGIETILVSSDFSDVEFRISLELKPYTMESLGYMVREK